MARTVSVTDEEILETVVSGDDPVRTVPDMAHEVDLGRDGLRRRLNKLEERGEVVSKRVGANAVVWWIPN